jgi:hypothetical protein
LDQRGLWFVEAEDGYLWCGLPGFSIVRYKTCCSDVTRTSAGCVGSIENRRHVICGVYKKEVHIRRARRVEMCWSNKEMKMYSVALVGLSDNITVQI